MSCPYKAASAPAPAADVPAKCPYSSPTAEPQRCPYASKDAPVKQQHCPYDDTEANRDWTTATGDEFKAHFEKTYDRVAAKTEATEKPSADRLARARRQAIRCGYTEEELSVIGDDTWLLQGTGNPHKLAKVVEGDVVVDLGSGLGIDAIVAASKVGARGRVIGVDLSSREILSALTRVRGRGLRNLDFRLGDIEAPPVDDATVDAVLSNGGFCLVPDKKKAFAEIFRMLRPGGASRMAISCTVRLAELESGKRWPSCFLVFMPMEDVHPVLTACGFVDIVVERCPDEEKEEKPVADGDTKPTATCHSTGNPDFAFLRDYDMNVLFARVNIYARKP